MERNEKNGLVYMTKKKYEQLIKNQEALKNMIQELIRLHEEEARLKRHHRAYLHVRDYINVVCDADKKRLEKMQEEMKELPITDSCSKMCCHEECCHKECGNGECCSQNGYEGFPFEMFILGIKLADILIPAENK